jgi:hypothetical protein
MTLENDFIFVRPSGEDCPKPEIEFEPGLKKVSESHKDKVTKLLQLPRYSEDRETARSLRRRLWEEATATSSVFRTSTTS